jgi:hypothetical protein
VPENTAFIRVLPVLKLYTVPTYARAWRCVAQHRQPLYNGLRLAGCLPAVGERQQRVRCGWGAFASAAAGSAAAQPSGGRRIIS